MSMRNVEYVKSYRGDISLDSIIFCERISTTNVALLVKRDLKAGVMETGCRRKQRKAFRREDGLRSLCWFALRLPRTLSTATLQFSLCCLQRRASVFFQIREQLILKMGVTKRRNCGCGYLISCVCSPSY